MKEQYNIKNTSITKKIFIKICRILGYEIVDQSSFTLVTQNKSLNENLSAQGHKSIILPLGETKISRKVKALTIIFRSCTNVNMLTQNKKRLFENKKSEYTFRSLNSIVFSIKQAKEKFPQINFDIVIVDHNSEKKDLDKMQIILDKSNLKNSFVSLDINEFQGQIEKVNAQKGIVTQNQISNMSNIHKSLQIAKNRCKDLIYFVEDDYLHKQETFVEMILAYERISSQVAKELILCPIDYPYLYSKVDPTNILLGSNKHWRVIDQTLCTFLTSINILENHWDKFVSMCLFEHYPFEQPLHNIYKTEYCLSPIPSLALHCTNINSSYGLSPTINWKKIWDENKNY